VRKFFCDLPYSERRVFAERLDDVARVHARGTDRQREALEWIAFALDGKAGARLARQLSLHVSLDTLLNRIREAFCADDENVRVLGVDDIGLGRDNAPGTILVDLERHKIVDLLGELSVVAVSSYISAQIVTPAPEQATRFARADDVFLRGRPLGAFFRSTRIYRSGLLMS
jgi:transposase